MKKKIEASKEKKEQDSIAEAIKEVVAEDGSSSFKFIGSQR